MSIHSNAIPETSKIREQTNLRPTDMTPPRKPQESGELEISLPMLVLLVVAVGLLIYGAVTFFGKKNGPDVTPKTPPDTLAAGLIDVTVSLDYITILKDTPKVNYIFIEISDFECPYCKVFSIGSGDGRPSTFAEIRARYIDSGIMKFGYAPYTAVPQHKPAVTNETVGFYCAAAQKKAAEYHEYVFSMTSANGLGIDKKGAERSAILGIAKKIGVNEAEFTACYDKRDIVAIDKVQEKINKEIKTPWGDKYGANYFGTPAFAVCKISADNPTTCVGKAYVGAWPYADMKNVLDTFLGADAPK